MKLQLKPLAISLCLLGMVATPALAVSVNDESNQALVQKVDQLQREMADLKKQLKPHRKISHKRVAQKNPKSHITRVPQRVVADTSAQISGPSHLPTTGTEYLPYDLDVPGQSFVSTGPYIGVELQYSGSDLIINNPSVNNDVALLNLRKNINQRLVAMGRNPEEQRSHLLLSGVVEGQIAHRAPGGGHSRSDIDVTNVGLEAYILGPSSWTSGLISLTYDNNLGTATGSLSNNFRSENSRVLVKKAFITIGDFSKSPFYGTIGQLYVPFGTYSSAMISSSLPKLMARTQARAVVLGYQQQTPNAFYGSLYTFRGDTRTGSVNRISNGGVNVGYRFKGEPISGNIGGGIIANLADSEGMQDTGNAPAFGGFGGTGGSGSERIAHRVPAVNLRGSFSIQKNIDVIAEYVAATRRFSASDMTMNSHGARPQALNVEASYSFQNMAKPLSVGVGYGMTKDALALGLPESRVSAVLNTSLWKNTLESIEFRHDNNYRASSIASGSGVAAPSASGKSDNAIFAQIDIYF